MRHFPDQIPSRIESNLGSRSLRRALVSFCAVGMALQTVGCTARTGEKLPPSGLDMPAEGATKGSVGPDIKKESRAIHHYLVGQLSYNSEDFDSALSNFAQSSELTEDTEPVLHIKLAELYVRFSQLDKALNETEIARKADPDDSYTQLLHAGILVALNRPDEAKPIYEALIQKDPEKFDPYILLSSLYNEQKQFDQSIQVLSKLTTRAPNEPIGYYYSGRTYELMGKLDKAETSYHMVRKLDPSGEKGLIDLIRVLVRQKKVEKAQQLCLDISKQDPNNATARKLLAQLMVGQNKLDEALTHFQAAEELEEDPTDTRFKIALIQIEKQNFREALRELSLVLAKNPKHDEARYYLASLYAGSGRRKEAVEELFKIERDSEMFVKSRTFAAFVLRQNKDLEGAEKAVREAYELAEDKNSTLLYLTVILRDLEKYSEAEKLLADALKSDPSNDRLLFNRAIVLHELGREDESLTAMEELIRLHPEHSDGLNFVAYCLAEKNENLERAETLAKKALTIRQNDAYYLDTLGWVYFKRGQLDKAETSLERAVTLSQDDAVIIEHYVEILVSHGNITKAISVLKAIAEKDTSEVSDKDKLAAFDRLKKRYKLLLEANPGLKKETGNMISDPRPSYRWKTSAIDPLFEIIPKPAYQRGASR